jgi:hypothetical protein
MPELYGLSDVLVTLLRLMSPGFPSRISRRKVQEHLKQEEIQWLAEHDTLFSFSPDEYGLVDEFIRVRFILETAESAEDEKAVELQILEQQDLIDYRDYYDRS